jgi:hypothetical protein
VAVDERDQSNKISIAILDQKPAPKTIKAIEINLARFGQHKRTVIDHLSRSRLSKAKDFDGEKWWDRLTPLAEAYFLQREMPPAFTRKASLLKLAEILGEARNLAEEVRQDNAGAELISHLFDGTLPHDPPGQLIPSKDGSIEMVYFDRLDFEEMVPALSAYEAAVQRSANYLPSTPPGQAPFLPPTFIRALAEVYLGSTERKPGAGAGPFARFVMLFRAALDPSYEASDDADRSVVDAVQDALRKPRVQVLTGSTE